MKILHRYADFGSVDKHIEIEENTDALEDIKLVAFENGYQSGWEDAAGAHATETMQSASEINQRLQDMSFTHHEVYTKFSLTLKPLMVQFVMKLLPSVAQRSLHGHILEEIDKLVDLQADSAVVIAVSVESLDALKSLLKQHLPLPFEIIADLSLSPGQVHLRVGKTESEVDLDAILNGLTESIDAFFDRPSMESTNE